MSKPIKQFKILDDYYAFHNDHAVYPWVNNNFGCIPLAVKKNGEWFRYGTGYKLSVNTLDYFKSIDLNALLNKELLS